MSVIKQNDPNHLVGVGDEGFFKHPLSRSFLYDGKNGVDAARLLDIHAVDFGTFHLYPQGWGQDRDFGRKWIEEHLKLGRSAGKPMLLEEFGVSLDGNFVSGTEDRNALYAEWLDAAAEQDGAGTLFWMLAGGSFEYCVQEGSRSDSRPLVSCRGVCARGLDAKH